ncbi:MAG: alpha-hydroxy-acid oxidizing protein [Anaerolineaceae bacterium]|nr:MAG: alpha-hydroxy-acid oxidizing protein [Anaerolineaceae bacterium]
MKHNMNLNDVLIKYDEYQKAARKILKPSCNVCKICNGLACAGRNTNSLEFGAKGNNAGFINVCKALADIRIEMDVIHENYEPDTSIELFGHQFDLPVFASPIGKILTDYTFDSKFFNNNSMYAEALIKGAYEAGGMAWLGDNAEEGYFEGQIASIPETGGVGVPTIKPWANREEFWKRVKLSQDAGAMAIATDLDSIGLGYQYSVQVGAKNEGVCSRDVEELKELVEAVDIPVVIKGVMSVKTAVKVAKTNAYGIVISNHGGNVIENSLAPCDMVEEIRNALGDSIKIFVDGGVRSGEDVFKLLALGADAVGIGRPYAVSVYGGGQDGAYIYTQKIYWELINIMRLANCRTLEDITRDKVVVLNKNRI